MSSQDDELADLVGHLLKGSRIDDPELTERLTRFLRSLGADEEALQEAITRDQMAELRESKRLRIKYPRGSNYDRLTDAIVVAAERFAATEAVAFVPHRVWNELWNSGAHKAWPGALKAKDDRALTGVIAGVRVEVVAGGECIEVCRPLYGFVSEPEAEVWSVQVYPLLSQDVEVEVVEE